MTGRIIRLFAERGFGFIKRDDRGKDVHFTISDVPEAKVGSRVEFELGGSDEKPHAESPRLVEGVTAPVSVPAPPVPPPKVEVTKDAIKPVVSWRFAAIENIMDLVRIPTYVVVKSEEGTALPGVVVQLFKVGSDGTRSQVLSPAKKATTDENGEAYFAVFITPGSSCELTAKIGLDYYSHPLPRDFGQPLPVPTPPAAPTATPPKAVSVEVTVLPLTATRRNPVRIITKDVTGKRASGEVAVVTGQNSILRHGEIEVAFTDRVVVLTDGRDHDPYLIQLLDRDARVTFICGDHQVTHTLLQEA